MIEPPQYIAEVFEKPTAEFLEYQSRAEILPPFKSRNPEEAVHLRTDSGCVFDIAVMYGYFELKKQFKAKESDIFVASFPKTGTTWLQEIVYIIGHNADLNCGKSSTLEARFPYMEFPLTESRKVDLKALPTPRFLKTHLPYDLLPKTIFEKGCKMIYITRNPKDTIVSMYHFYKMVNDYSYLGTFREFVDMFLREEVLYAPYDHHVLGYWEKRNTPNLLFVTYEDLQKNPVGTIKDIARFLDRPVDERQAALIAEQCCFGNMSTNKMVNYEQWFTTGQGSTDGKFMRKGKVGDWKNHFDEELNGIVDKWIQDKFGESTLEFQYKIS